MKTIGIKLADGTFYPILEEGTPKQRMLDLTTAKDNQTKVQIDLYRSENGTMEDAEYVDTLEVTKLNPHPNGEPELHLSVEIDEENKLTAAVVDPETGKKSETEVTLVSRTAAERAEPADFAISGAEEAASEAPADETTTLSDELTSTSKEETTYSSADLPEIQSDVLEDMPFSFDHSEPHVTSEISPTSSSASNETFKGELPDFSELDRDIPVEDTTLESVDFAKPESIPTGDENVEEPASDETIVSTGDDISSEEFSLPDFDDSDSNPEPENYDLPDFDSLTSESPDTDTTTNATGLNFDDLDDPAFNTTNDDDDFFGTSSDSSAAVGSAMDFSDLYDKETIAGEHASLYDEDEDNKKTRTPVIICIICAIICVIATILVLFIVPSKYNLIASRNTNGVSILDKLFSKTEKVEKVIEEPKEETKYIDVIVEEPKKEEAAPQAVEDKIVIAPEPEKVVPLPPPAPVEEKKPEVKKTADVNYHIRWGDTLWDISESYYKTPWKYPKIATYNKIKNPDLIIAGTDIKIPSDK